MQGGDLQPMVASGEEAAGEGLSDSASSAEEDIDEMGNDSDASSSSSDEIEEDEADEGAAGIHAGSIDRNPAAGKKQKTGVQANGLGSVGWDASDEEEAEAEPTDAGISSEPLCLNHNKLDTFLLCCCAPLKQPLLSQQCKRGLNNYNCKRPREAGSI